MMPQILPRRPRSDSMPLIEPARWFVPIFEGEFGDAGFIEIAEAFSNHAVVLFLGCERVVDRRIHRSALLASRAA